LSKTWALLERFDVPDFDRPEVNYLTRLRIVATPWFGIYLHRIGTPDSRPVLHDHPWSFLSLVLWGSYTEVTPVLEGLPPIGRKRRRVRWANWKPARSFHYIAELHTRAVWTLVFTGPRKRTWGYWDAEHGGWVEFDKHPVLAPEFDRAMAERQRLRGGGAS